MLRNIWANKVLFQDLSKWAEREFYLDGFNSIIEGDLEVLLLNIVFSFSSYVFDVISVIRYRLSADLFKQIMTGCVIFKGKFETLNTRSVLIITSETLEILH